MLEIKTDEWDYITLPNKMYELVKNTGDMHKQRTGYFTDAESEMLTVLDYLNHGEVTNITESMIRQVEKAIHDATAVSISNNVIFGNDRGLSTTSFAKFYANTTKQNIAVIHHVNDVYIIKQYGAHKDVRTITRNSLTDGRAYLAKLGYCVRYPRAGNDSLDVVEAWI